MRKTFSPHVMVVEDCADQAALTVCWLSALPNVRCTHVATAESALEQLDTCCPDLIVLDVSLPGINGFEFALRARAKHADVAIMLITAHADVGVAIQAVRVQANDFLAKPLSRERLLESAVRLLTQRDKVLAARRKTVIAVGAHPDDAEIGCGGALLRHVQSGDQVVVLTLSRGEHGGNPSGRQSESTAAAVRLGAELRLGHFPDTRIQCDNESIGFISAAIREFNPDVVYTHSLNDVHQDHRQTHNASLVAARHVKTVLCYQSPSSTTSFSPSLFVDIGDTVAQKLALIDEYRSQTARCDYLDHDLLRATARYWSRFASGTTHVEPFQTVRVQDYSLAARPPVPDRGLKESNPTFRVEAGDARGQHSDDLSTVVAQ